MTWTVKQSRVVFSDRWIKVNADDCVTASGVELSPFYTLDYPDWVHVVALDNEDHLILVRQYRHGFRGYTLELPGGVIDAADVGPVEAAARELTEETGYTADVYRLLASLSPNPATHTNKVHVVLAQPAHWMKPPEPDPEESITVVRIPADEALHLALRGEMVHAQHVGLLVIGLQAANLLR